MRAHIVSSIVRISVGSQSLVANSNVPNNRNGTIDMVGKWFGQEKPIVYGL